MDFRAWNDSPCTHLHSLDVTFGMTCISYPYADSRMGVNNTEFSARTHWVPTLSLPADRYQRNFLLHVCTRCIFSSECVAFEAAFARDGWTLWALHNTTPRASILSVCSSNTNVRAYPSLSPSFYLPLYISLSLFFSRETTSMLRIWSHYLSPVSFISMCIYSSRIHTPDWYASCTTNLLFP